MPQYYINQDKTKFVLEKPISTLPSIIFHSAYLDIIEKYMTDDKKPEQTQEFLQKLKFLQKMLSPLKYNSRYGDTAAQYGIVSNYSKTNINVLKEYPIADLSDNTKTKKISWSNYEKLAALPKALNEVIVEVENKAGPNSRYSSTYKTGYYGRDETITLKAIIADLKKLENTLTSKVMPLLKSSIAINKEDFTLQDYEGSLESEKNFNVSAAYYLMGSHRGEEGFIGIDKTSHGSGDLYRFKIVKDLANAFIFHKDMKEALRAFTPLVRVDVEISFKGVQSPGNNKAAQKVQSFVDKAALENAIAFITPKEAIEPVVKKKHKI